MQLEIKNIKRNNNYGFTLIEFVLVIVIMGIMSAVAVQKIAPIAESFKVEETKAEMDKLSAAIVGNPELQNNGVRSDFGYVGDVGALPTNLDALVSNPGSYSTWNGPYINNDFEQYTNDFKKDAWQTNYTFSGVTITSTGSGSSVERRLAGTSDFVLYNQITGNVYDLDGTPPDDTYNDSISVRLTVPDGAGSTTTKSTITDIGGYFSFDSIPIGNHDLNIIYIPSSDTIKRFVSVAPHTRAYSNYMLNTSFASAIIGSIDSGRVGHWMFDESSGTTAADSSGENNNGTLHNMSSTSDWVSGKIDGALDFDGYNDYVDVLLAGNEVTNLSFSVWFNSDDGSSVGDNYVAQRFISQPRSSSYSRIAYGINDGRLAAFWYDGDYRVDEGTTTITAGVWYHAVLTYDGATIRIYLNTVEENSFSESSLSAPSGNLFQIGQQISGERRFDGTLDDVRIYDWVLTPTEIQELYNLGN